MKRKDFISLLPLFAGVLLGFVPFSIGNLSKKKKISDLIGESINYASASRIGRAYIGQNPKELHQIRNTSRKISGSLTSRDSESSLKRRQFVDDRIRNDYANNRIVLFNNWVLSETEVAICVLAADFSQYSSS